MVSKASFIDVIELHSGESLAVYRDPNGGVFGVDASYVEHVADDEDDIIFSPFTGKPTKLVDLLVEDSLN